MSQNFTVMLRPRNIAIAMLVTTALVPILSNSQLTQAFVQTNPTASLVLPNAAVYEISNDKTRQVGLHAPGSVSTTFTIPNGQYVAPNGRFAIAQPSATAFAIYDLQTETQSAGGALPAGSGTPGSMAVSPNGQFAAVASQSPADQTSWTVTVFNLQASTNYTFGGKNSTTAVSGGSPGLQSLPRIEGWVGDESAIILSTSIPGSTSSNRLFFNLPMSELIFAASGDITNPVPAVTPLAADQTIKTLVFSPDSTRAAFLYADPENSPANFSPVATGTRVSVPPNALKVVNLISGAVQPIAEAAAGQGITAPAWSPDGAMLYFGAGPFQGTPFPVSLHLFSYDFSSGSIDPGTALIGTDPTHIGVSEMQVCVGQVFMREVSVGQTSPTIATPGILGRIVSAPLVNPNVHATVYPTVDNALGPCVPSLTGATTGSVLNILPSVPVGSTSGVCGPTSTATPPVIRRVPTKPLPRPTATLYFPPTNPPNPPPPNQPPPTVFNPNASPTPPQ